MTIIHYEIDFKNLNDYLNLLIEGSISSLLIKRVMNVDDCNIVYDNFMNSPGLHHRNDGIPALMVGSNTFLKNPQDILLELEKNIYAEMLFHGVKNIYQEFYDCIQDGGYKFRRSYYNGVPLPMYRGVIWRSGRNNTKSLLAHTDWPQVKNSNMEYKNVNVPIAINFYARHPENKQSGLRVYNLIPDHDFLKNLGIEKGGYPIDDKYINNLEYVDIFPDTGDILLFNSSYVHSVIKENRECENNDRLNINGFLGLCNNTGRILCWA